MTRCGDVDALEPDRSPGGSAASGDREDGLGNAPAKALADGTLCAPARGAIRRPRSIAVRSGHQSEAELRSRAASQAWLRVVRRDSSALKEMLLGRIRVKGPLALLKAFGRCFA